MCDRLKLNQSSESRVHVRTRECDIDIFHSDFTGFILSLFFGQSRWPLTREVTSNPVCFYCLCSEQTWWKLTSSRSEESIWLNSTASGITMFRALRKFHVVSIKLEEISNSRGRILKDSREDSALPNTLVYMPTHVCVCVCVWRWSQGQVFTLII